MRVFHVVTLFVSVLPIALWGCSDDSVNKIEQSIVSAKNMPTDWRSSYPQKEDLHWLSQPSYKEIIVSSNARGSVDFGTGIVMRNRWDPDFLPTGPLSGNEEESLVHDPVATLMDSIKSDNEEFLGKFNDTVSNQETTLSPEGFQDVSIKYRRNLTAEEKAFYLHAFFKAQAGVGTYSAALEYARERRESHEIIFIDAAFKSSKQLDGWSPPTVWPVSYPPKTEDIDLSTAPEIHKALDIFIDSYGSHYVESITVGWRLIAKIEINNSVFTQRAKLEAAMQYMQARGNLTAEYKEVLSSEGIDVHLEIVAGSLLKPDGSAYQPALEGIQAVTNVLNDYRSYKLNIRPTVLSVNARSYWPILYSVFPKSAQFLQRFRGSEVIVGPSIYGVPKGTIISWLPPDNYWIGEGNNRRLRAVPEGWTLLPEAGYDGHGGDFFLQNTVPTNSGVFGGHVSHGHKTSGGSRGDSKDSGGGSHNNAVTDHTHTVIDASNIPPHLKVVFLMKL